MLFTPSRTEERVRSLARASRTLRATAAEIAAAIQGDVEDTRRVLDELVARNELRRHEIPGERPIYWT